MSTHIAAADRWRKIIQQHQRSGLTVLAFCRRAGVSEPSFYAWRRKLRDEVTFAEIRLSRETICETEGIELRLPGRRCVVVRPGFDRQALLDLLHVLETNSSDEATPEAIR
jgi:transposase-like protein